VKISLKSTIDTKLFRLIGETADENRFECYLIGGFVRDIILKRKSKDIDIVVVGDGVEFAKILAKKIGRGVSLSIFKTYGTAQIKTKNTEIEIVGARKESYQKESRNPIVEVGTLEDDQNRRDFTINALAICLNNRRFGEVIDPFNGLEDLQNKIIQTPLDPDITFSDDPLRMMRAIRFASQLNFRITDKTLFSIWKNRERISIITKERITEELNKIILSPKPSIGFFLLDKTELLPLILPELSQMKGIDKNGYRAHKDNFIHTLKVLDKMAELSDDLWLRWASLLHDIGKPATKKWDENLGWTFHNHNLVGCKMVAKIFKNLKLPLSDPLKFVQKMVLLHMRPITLSQENVTDSAVRRLLFDAGNDIDALMTLCRCDITSNNMEKVRQFSDNFNLVSQKLVELEIMDKIRNFQPPVDGLEIMNTFGLQPCSLVGELKVQIKDAILDGIIPNEHDSAFEFLLKIAAEKGINKV
jgi:poly(A) polymerase